MENKWLAIVTRNLNTGSDHASIYLANLLLSAEEVQVLDVTDWMVHVPPVTNNVSHYRGAFSSREAAIRCVKRDFPGIRVAATVREG